AFDADASSVMAFDDGRPPALRVLRSSGFPHHLVDDYGRIGVEAELPPSDAVRRREAVLLGSLEERAARYPKLAAVRPDPPFPAMAAIPLLVEDHAVGALVLGFRQPRALSGDDGAFMLALALQCAQAMERARLYELEQRARASAERASDRANFLAEASQ